MPYTHYRPTTLIWHQLTSSFFLNLKQYEKIADYKQDPEEFEPESQSYSKTEVSAGVPELEERWGLCVYLVEESSLKEIGPAKGQILLFCPYFQSLVCF